MKNISTYTAYNESKKIKQFGYTGNFYLTDANEYISDKFRTDFVGKHGGDFFDFVVNNIKRTVDQIDGEYVTRIMIEGTFETDLDYDRDTLTNMLMEYVGDVVESYTKKYPQEFNIEYYRIVRVKKEFLYK